MNFFISDTHFNHQNIIKYTTRPYKTCQQMNEALIKNWNETVTNNDTVYFLGDFLMGRSRDYSIFINQLNFSTLYFVRGNHDQTRDTKSLDKCDRKVVIVKSETVLEFDTNCGGTIKLCLSHFPMEIWPGIDDGVVNVHGHIHDKAQKILKNRVCVCVERTDYKPVDIDWIINESEKTWDPTLTGRVLGLV